MAEIYLSTDIEADGPIPGPFSMLSLGVAAYSITQEDGVKLIDQFSVNFKELKNASRDIHTMEWWRSFPLAWNMNRNNPIEPVIAMQQYADWIKSLNGEPVFVAWPATYDFSFVYWYLINFLGKSPFRWSGLDARSYAMAITKKPWLDVSMRDIDKGKFPANPHPHVAIYDAIEQGWQVCSMIYDNMFNNK